MYMNVGHLSWNILSSGFQGEPWVREAPVVVCRWQVLCLIGIFDWILWLQWFQWRHSLFKLRPIEKRIAFVFCHRRNKLGIFAVPACTCPRCFTVAAHCLWCSPFLFWPAPTVYFTRIFIVMVRSHPAVHSLFCRWYNHIPLYSPFCEAM